VADPAPIPANAAQIAFWNNTATRVWAALPQRREAVRAALTVFFEGHDGPEGITLPGALWLVQGRA
jgi:hypothetical protein